MSYGRLLIEEEACRMQLAVQMRKYACSFHANEILQYFQEAVKLDNELWPSGAATLASLFSPNQVPVFHVATPFN